MKKSLLYCALMCISSIANAQTVVNGGVTGAPVGNSQLANAAGWSTCGFSPDLCDVTFAGFLAASTVPAVPSPQGGSWLGVASITGIECAQTTITGLTVGQTYTLCFYAANFGCSSYSALVGQPRVEVGPTSQIFDVNQGSFWTLYSMNFVADAATMPLRVFMQNYGLGNSYCSLDGFVVGTTTCSVILPVEMIEFEATPVDFSNVELTWKTLSERNNDHFIIERSSDLKNWEYVGQLDGAGNSTSPTSYKLNDLLPNKGLSYYRCTQIDFDGQKSSPGIIAIDLPTKNTTELSVYPNPTDGKITVSGAGVAQMEITAFNSVGEKLEISTSHIEPNAISVDLSKYHEGVFIIRVGAESFRVIKTP